MRTAGWLYVTAGVLAATLCGWRVAAVTGAAIGGALGIATIALPVRKRSPLSWGVQYLRRNRPLYVRDLSAVHSEQASVGVRCDRDVAIAAVRVFGSAHEPTRLTAAGIPSTKDYLDLGWLLPTLHQSLGITLDSMSVVTTGSRHGQAGEHSRIYDTLIGAQPYAGRREMWLLIRLHGVSNSDAMRWRRTLGAAAAAAAQRIAATLRQRGLRARAATVDEIERYEMQVGRASLCTANRSWHFLRGDSGWLTTYGYEGEIDTEKLSQAWLWQVDGVTQNVTLFPDGTATAMVTTRTSQPPKCPPSATLRTLSGEQVAATAFHLCLARRHVAQLGKVACPPSVLLQAGPSGVLIGKDRNGSRVLLPLSDPVEESRVHIAADDRIAKRILIRLGASGERITIHSTASERWRRLRIPGIGITSDGRSEVGTTVTVLDGSVATAPRCRTVISIAALGASDPPADVVLEQVGPGTLRVVAPRICEEIDVEMFRVEDRYLPVANAAPARPSQ